MRRSRAVALRPACGADAPAMAAMSRVLIEGGLAWRYTPQRMAALIGDPDTIALVACDESGVQGFAVMRFADEHAHLALLCVRPPRRRAGIGRRLHEWLLASARVAGMASIRLELRADNAAALAFYRRLGFEPTVLRPGYYDGRVSAQCMALQLCTLAQ